MPTLFSTLLLPMTMGNDLPIEEKLVAEEACAREMPIRHISLKKLRQKQADSLPRPGELPVGDIPFIHAILQALGKPIPLIDYYPEVLSPWLFRRVWKQPMKYLLRDYETGRRLGSVFIKPADRVKDFTGRVVCCEQEIREIPSTKNGWIYCSEPVEWLAEWRVYVIEGKIRSIHSYEPTPCSIDPNRAEMELCIDTLMSSGWKRRTLAIDLGLLTTGQTALVEVGDGYSIGAYGISSRDYFEFIEKAWMEIIAG